MNKTEKIDLAISEHINLLNDNQSYFQNKIEEATSILIEALINKKQILWCGNGGSAAQASHLSAELVGGMFKKKKSPLKSLCLNTDTAFITAWSNDDSYDNIFSRQIESIGTSGDVLVALTTSGNSHNIINAIKIAKSKKIVTISLTGNDGGEVSKLSDFNINIFSNNTARIQELHILIGHIICEIVETNYNS